MEITQRQKEILFAVVQEHTKDAQPVGSKKLADLYSLGIGPAMIRQEMGVLEHEGYIEQPHISAGRVPTDKAYRLYITEMNVDKTKAKSKELSLREQQEIEGEIEKHYKDAQRLMQHISRVVSHISGDLSVSGTAAGSERYAHGFSLLAHEEEFNDGARLENLMSFFDGMDRHFEMLWRAHMKSSLGILVGGENPIKEIRHLSVVTGRYPLHNGQIAFVSIIGPRRMNYQKNAAVIRHIQNILHD
jgi:transcriptional regulator of heat shock response